ncbi:penicillin acylase family protein [Actibacterium sp. 188UL27-1]|uniref:penicillin acylase family protein n=1 Tax=Actibacterium sp. 188UL27-1 TaxID=2786961 RepID=UPI0019580E2E|nr:penicillin acylase family protein [Actibacterium sp. 188UL27-1]MBM7069657.1 penicillin acylase family protein [Actibacterium sp. 188UL27-1]
MALIFRWLMRLFMVMAVFVGLAVVFVYYLASRSLPDYDATYELSALTSPVEIVRDNANVPHIFAEADSDVFFGLGFAHAQDRLWQMTLLRRTAQGRLSELFGQRTVRTDELMRRFGLYRAAERSVGAQDAETMVALNAYAAGVNAWIETVNTQALGRGAPEFFMFSRQIAPWRPADSIAVTKLMAFQLSGHLQNEVLRAQVSLALPPERVQDLMPDAPGTGVVDLPDYTDLFPRGHQVTMAAIPPDQNWLSPFQTRELAGASNAWAAAPKRSAAGGTLLANDPHLGFSAPSIWYLARMELSEGGVIGATIPGMPAILAGRSDALGWAITSSYLDDQDIFMEELNPANRQEYRTPSGWAPFKTERTIIRVKDAAPVTITLRNTENGPVLPGTHFELASVTPPGHVAAIGWTALDPADTSIKAGLDLMRAKSVTEAADAMEPYVAPSQNLTLIDAERIAMQVIGAVPARAAGNVQKGRLPALGWQAQNRWDGRLAFDRNPRFLDPEGGLLGNTNNKTVNRPFPDHLSYHWGDTQRIERWRKLMQDREVHTRESFIDAQLDTVSTTARGLLPLMARDLWYTGEAAQPGTPEAQRNRALDLLANWNGEMNEHLPEPLIYAAWLRQLHDKLIRDDLGPFADHFTHADPIFIERVFRDIDGAGVWCDIRQSTITESCVDISRIALDEALLWIGQTYGTALESLRWGDAHAAEHNHPVLGETPILKWLVNIRQSTSGGDHTLMRGKTSGEMPDPFTNVHGAGYRGVYDFADPDSSLFVTATGQSGHPLSRHYDDLGVLWRRGEYIRMSLDPDLARAAAVGITRLSPR